MPAVESREMRVDEVMKLSVVIIHFGYILVNLLYLIVSFSSYCFALLWMINNKWMKFCYSQYHFFFSC